MSKNRTTKMGELYKQCFQAYVDPHTRFESTVNDIPDPGFFEDEFRVPEELLYQEACTANREWDTEREEFCTQLLKKLCAKESYDDAWITSFKKPRIKWKQFTVFLEIFYRPDQNANSPKLFNTGVTVKDITFSPANKSEFIENVVEFLRKDKSNQEITIADAVNFIKNLRRNPHIFYHVDNNIEVLKTSMYAPNEQFAAEQVMQAYELLENCFNVSQAKGKFSIRLGGPNLQGAHSKTVLINTGTYYVFNNDHGFQYFQSTKQRDRLPHDFLKQRSGKQKLYEMLLSATTAKTPIQSRVANIVRELAAAYDAEDLNIRQLGFWRCLEHATRKTGAVRKEKEIIDIFENYIDADYWRKMGELIKQTRNDYVHEGVMVGEKEVADQYVNWAQRYAEAALNIILYLYEKSAIVDSSERIDDFFDYYPKTNKSLDIAKMMLEERKQQ